MCIRPHTPIKGVCEGLRAHLPARYLSREGEDLWFQLEQQKKKTHTRRVASTRTRTQRSRATAGLVAAQAVRTSMLKAVHCLICRVCVQQS